MRSTWVLLLPLLAACQPRPSASLSITPEAEPTPQPSVEPPEAAPRLHSLSINEDSGCVVQGERRVMCWDLGFERPRERLRVAEPFTLEKLDAAIVDLHLDDRRVCALDERGRVFCRGIIGDEEPTTLAELGSAGKMIVHSPWQEEQRDVCVLASDSLTCERGDQPSWNPVVDAAFGTRGDGCALLPDGSWRCWPVGQLDAPKPASPVPRLPGAVEIEFDTRLCLRTDEGKLWCSSYASSPESVQLSEVPLARPIVDVELGDGHLCGLTAEGEVLCTGNNGFGQLGSGDSEAQSASVSVPLPGPAVELALAGRQSCAIVGTDVLCWGASMPELQRTDSHSFPLAATRLFADDDENCAIVGGELHCWSGSHFDVDAAPGGITAMSKPMYSRSAVPADQITAIDFDNLLAGGTVYYGSLFDHLDDWELEITWKKSGVETFAADSNLTCMARGKSQRLECVDDEGKPHRIPSISGVEDIEVRDTEICVISQGEVDCLAYDYDDEDNLKFGEWTRLEGVADAVEITEAYNRFELCARRASGQVTCWTEYERTAFDVDVDDAVQTVGFDDDLCVIDGRGALRCGPGLPDDTALHTLIESGVVEIVGGFDHVCARVDDDKDGKTERIECHGSNKTGQLGKLPETLMLKPTKIRLGP